MPKPAKPRPDFPLFAHNSGQWAKKIRGRTHYFGVWADATAALERYIRERDDLYSGREPRRDGQLSVADGCNHYLRQSLALLPSDGEPDAPIFATRTGRPLVGHKLDAVGQQFRRLLASLGIDSPGVGFYGLRHTFQTIGEGSKDPVAVRWIMGHAADAGDMASVYRESIDPGRLVSVVNHVRNWLGFAG